jgi:hypothetical protein
LEVFVSFLSLVTLLSPLGNELSVEDKDMEESIEKKDNVVLDGHTVKKNGLRRRVEGVRHKCRLDHDERVVDIFLVKNMSGKIQMNTRMTL